MKRAIVTILSLLAISLSALAATVMVDGKAAGTLQKLTVGANGDVVVTTGTVSPPPIDPPAAACPQGVTCIDRAFPVLVQEVLSLKAGQVLAVRVKTPDGKGAGRVTTMYTTGNTAARRVSLSATPGDTDPGNTKCTSSGLEITTNDWSTDSAALRTCVLPPGSTAFINIRTTNCPDGMVCKFYLKGS